MKPRVPGHEGLARTATVVTSASDRFNYDYPEKELTAIALNITALDDRVQFTHVILNNNMEDQGQRNAVTLTRILRQQNAATLALHETQSNKHGWPRA
jgi:uncharacterized protein YecE (DUF72 family)